MKRILFSVNFVLFLLLNYHSKGQATIVPGSLFEKELTSLNLSKNAKLIALNCEDNRPELQICLANLSQTNHHWKKDAAASFSETCILENPEKENNSNSNEATVAIPDPIFEQYLVEEKIDSDRKVNGKILKVDAEMVEKMSPSGLFLHNRRSHIEDLTGIEAFINLVYLNCSSNELTSLDLSKNTKLKHLHLSNNNLTSIDLSNNKELETLDFLNNELSDIDLSHHQKLTTLDCYNNQLTKLDLSNNTKLTYVRCPLNKLTSLDFRKQPDLTEVDCSSNELTSLEFSYHPELEVISCNDNRLTSLYTGEIPSLRLFYCQNNKLTSLNLDKNRNLDLLSCTNNLLKTIHLRNNKILTALYCENNQLTDLNLINNPKLEDLKCKGNLSTLKICVYKLYRIDYQWEKDEKATYSENCH